MKMMLPAKKRGRPGKADAEQYAHMQPRYCQQMRCSRAPECLIQVLRDVPPQSKQRRLPESSLRFRHNSAAMDAASRRLNPNSER